MLGIYTHTHTHTHTHKEKKPKHSGHQSTRDSDKRGRKWEKRNTETKLKQVTK